MWTVNLQIFKLVLEKAEEPEIKLPTSAGSSKKQESSRKTSISALLTMPKPLTVQITINCGKFLKRWEYQTTWPAFWEICMQVKKQQLELDMEQWTGSKLGKEYVKAVYYHPTYLTYMQSSVQFSCSVISISLQPHELQHARPPCPSPTPGVHPNPCPLSWDAIQASHPLSSPSPLALNLSQHQGLFKWVSSSHEVAKVLEFQF